MAQISCDRVSMGYEKKIVVENVSFEANKGDYLCIVGENGSGKTTLMKGMLGLMPLKSGKIYFDDNIKPDEIGYLPQRTIIQSDFPASVSEVVLSGCLNKRGLKPFYSLKDKERAADSMRTLGIWELKNKSYKALSGGQQQRALLARALCATEKILLLDEPAAGLDPVVTAELYQIIRKLNEDKGVTIIMISHDINIAVQNANKILHMGTSAKFCGSTETYMKSEAIEKFLGNLEGNPPHGKEGLLYD